MSRLNLVVILASSLLAATAPAQTSDPLAQLTPEQKQSFNSDVTLSNAGKFTEALTGFRALLAEIPAGTPANAIIAKFAAEASLNAGGYPYAFTLIKPLETANPGDWQARSLLARYYTETGDKAQRDAELAALLALHKADPQSAIGKLSQFQLEHDKLSNGGDLRIWYSLEPWGQYKTYVFSRVYDKAGVQTLRIKLESSDFDQPSFVKEHPDLAAKGERRFSMDGYGPDQKLPNGSVTQSHMLFGFFDGQPSYDVIRERIVAIAEGRKAPLSRTDTSKPH